MSATPVSSPSLSRKKNMSATQRPERRASAVTSKPPHVSLKGETLVKAVTGHMGKGASRRYRVLWQDGYSSWEPRYCFVDRHADGTTTINAAFKAYCDKMAAPKTGMTLPQQYRVLEQAEKALRRRARERRAQQLMALRARKQQAVLASDDNDDHHVQEAEVAEEAEVVEEVGEAGEVDMFSETESMAVPADDDDNNGKDKESMAVDAVDTDALLRWFLSPASLNPSRLGPSQTHCERHTYDSNGSCTVESIPCNDASPFGPCWFCQHA